LPAVLYGPEARSRTQKEEHGRRMFENRLLREIFVPKGEEVTGDLEGSAPCSALWSVCLSWYYL